MRVLLILVAALVAGCTSVSERALEQSYGRQDRLESAADMVRAEARRAAARGDTEGAARAGADLAALQDRIARVETERAALLESAKQDEADRRRLWKKVGAGAFTVVQLAAALFLKGAKTAT